MSAQAAPITLATFREALKSLTVQSLYVKVDELRNSIAHLNDSNRQLELFVQDMRSTNGGGGGGGDGGSDDQECIEAIQENEVVIARFQDRINLLAAEIENRGLGFQIATTSTTSSSPLKKNQLSILANKVNGPWEDANLVTDLPSTINEKIPINSSNHHGVDANGLMTQVLSNTGSQLENETSQETFAGTVNNDEGVYL
ncbi:hypothetical protein EPUL_001924 [Erysiphe pulchra]|uniref:Uncharacterized protein n=1 Tax=Erysiphe pulchra TaxID=225359 RepID=A0A2S4PZS6_9PEZI|nr:hypothetical protein EPUL_001924 [Erysiphe pulchra]